MLSDAAFAAAITGAYRANLLLPHLQPPAKSTRAEGASASQKDTTQTTRDKQASQRADLKAGQEKARQAKASAAAAEARLRSLQTKPTTTAANRPDATRTVEDRVTLTQLSERNRETLAEQNLVSHRQEETARAEAFYRTRDRLASEQQKADAAERVLKKVRDTAPHPPAQAAQENPQSQPLAASAALNIYRRHGEKNSASPPAAALAVIA